MHIDALALEIREDGTVYFEGKKATTQCATRGYQHLRIPVHRLVARAFHGPPPTPQHVCHHIDANPRNNSATNLRWLTQRENMKQKVFPRRLTRKQVSEILERKPAPRITLADMARSFGVCKATIEHVRSGRTWRKGWHPHNRRRLTEEQIKMIRTWTRPVITAAKLARHYKVSDVTILNIWHGRYKMEE